MPILTISARVGETRGNFTALVDSGADITILPCELAEAFGIDFAKLPPGRGPATGAGGRFEMRTAKGQLSYAGHVFLEDFAVAAKGHLPGPLLGRGDFMRAFVVRFNWHKSPPEFHVGPVMAPIATARRKGKV